MIIAISNNEQINVNISRPNDRNDLDANVENIMQLTDELTGIYHGIYQLYGAKILFEMLDEAIKRWQEGAEK